MKRIVAARKLLGVEWEATLQEMKTIYRTFMKEWHPDKIQDNPVANNESALLYRKTGRFKEARQVYEQTLMKYPNFNIMHKNLGILCDLYLKDYECALKHYVFYSNAVQDDKTVKIWIADVQKRVGK